MSSEITSDLSTTMFTDKVKSSFSTGVFPDSGNYAIVIPLLKVGNDRDELLCYRPLY